VTAQAGVETFMLGLRLADGVPWGDIDALGAGAGAWTAAARRLAQRGLLEVDGSGVRVPQIQRRLTDEVVLALWREAEPKTAR
jgi:coproporphyrinogen III oxidase-like Fe-S oxidoreductase